MKTSDFHYDLPAERIAQYPAPRGESRLMLLERGSGRRSHHRVSELPRLLESGSLLVFNDSRVRKARIFGTDSRGSDSEFLLLAPLDADFRLWSVMSRNAARRVGRVFRLADGTEAVLERRGSLDAPYALRFTARIDDAWLETRGHVPLPPYIRREDAGDDDARYQTVYARDYGSAAAPTAGLHFTEALLAELRERGIGTAFISLHVGPGTFLPVRSAEVEGHRMHTEAYCIGEEAAARIEAAKREGRKVVACGTTALRAMEAAWRGGAMERGCGRTDIFIYGDYRFRTADALFTNFHVPESTLLMLVCAFAGGEAGRAPVLDAYREAIAAGYNFFSYGDAMLLQ